MGHRYYNLPSLTALTAFEAAARHRSFKGASIEMNVTAGAISRQIKALEEELGVPLFRRSTSGLEVTVEAENLYAVLSSGFSRLSRTVEDLRCAKDVRRVTLACTNAFASMWLMPRMNDFWRRHPDISVDHLITDNAKDLRRADVDLRIRYGSGVWPDERATLLLKETIYPICAPAFANRHADAAALDIPSLPLLHVDWLDSDWTDWHEFLRRVGIPHGPLAGRKLSNFAVTMQACQDEQGLAIGWHRLVRRSLRSGELVRFSDLSIEAPGSYHLTWNDHRVQTPAVETVRDWLVEMAKNDLEDDAA